MVAKKFGFFIYIFAFISIITLYSTRSILSSNLDNIYLKQIIFYTIGLLVFFLMKNNKLIFKYITIIYIVSCVLLFSLLIFAAPVNNAKCWFIIPFLGTFQPSEFVKVILVIMTATILTKNIKYKFIIAFIIFLIPTVLTFLEPDTGLVIIYSVSFLSIISCYLKKSRYLIFIFIIILTCGILFFYLYQNKQEFLMNILGDSFLNRVDRIINWKNQDGYQLSNALIAIGSSGFSLSFNRINTYFPEAYTDFIFASFASSFGYFFTIIFLVIIIHFDLFLFDLAKSEKNIKNKLIIIGFTSIIIYEQIQNIGMNIGLLPITGITLPFISYGGSSLISNILMLTIIKNCKKKRNFDSF